MAPASGSRLPQSGHKSKRRAVLATATVAAAASCWRSHSESERAARGRGTVGHAFAGIGALQKSAKPARNAREGVVARRSQTRLVEEAPNTIDEEKQPRAVRAWLTAARRQAAGKPDVAAYLEVAWNETEAWWLRPIAYMTAVSLGLVGSLQRSLDKEPAQETRVVVPDSGRRLGADDEKAVLRALQDLQLPFFATSATWEGPPTFGMHVKGSIRTARDSSEPLRWDAQDSERIANRVTGALDTNVTAHLLRIKPQKEGEASAVDFEILLRDADTSSSSFLGDVAYPSVSLLVAVACASALGSNQLLATAGSVVAPGSAAPLALLLGLLFFGEATRAAVASKYNASLAPPFFVPSPQLGMLGVFRGPAKPLPSREASLAVALSAPLAIGVMSLVLILVGNLLMGLSQLSGAASGGGSVDLAARSTWLFAALPGAHCDPLIYVGSRRLR
eukprot:TRINITY_DN44616_c0_g1_i4.p1 TRINITY_DN44616_c0_g1~~TRINITY_DN44616_c0_g1_i4.p1  ORF type:complete len:448 (+),score=83.69 TRINITY_DN44616_c0_g1_i4:106-1449(+)